MDNLSLKQFGQFVYNYCGLNYLDKLSSLQLKMKDRLDELQINNFWEYIRYVESHENEWVQIVEKLTVNETYFFREDKQLSVLQQKIVPELLQSNNKLKIWSAACSTGDEPYSIAMMLDGYIGKEDYDINIFASDINHRVLQIAEKAAYSKTSLSFRRIPSQWLTGYFDETASHYIVKEKFKKVVKFENINLCKLEEHLFMPKFDVIFCRNVLIYFDDETIKRIIEHFYNRLNPGGYLFLGHAETITKYDSGFQIINRDGAFYYQKGSL